MALEPTPPPHPETSKLDLTEGPLNWKRAQPFLILIGVVVLGGLAINSLHVKHQEAAKQGTGTQVPTGRETTPPLTVNGVGNKPTSADDLMHRTPLSGDCGVSPCDKGPNPQVFNAGGGGSSYSAPQETPEQQQARERKKHIQDLEDASVFSSSLVAQPGQPAKQDSGNKEHSDAVQPSDKATGPPAKETTPDPFAFDPSRLQAWLPEHTIINAVLDSKIDGEFAGPIDAHVSMPVYTYDGKLIFPQGTMLLGSAEKVSQFGLNRVAVVFHKAMVYPSYGNPYSVSLDQNTPGMGQEGTPGVDGRVNNHFWSTFGAASAVGLISGISLAGSYSNGTYSPQVGIYNGISQSVSQATDRVLERYLNRMPTITIEPGKRMIVELISNLKSPVLEGSHE